MPHTFFSIIPLPRPICPTLFPTPNLSPHLPAFLTLPPISPSIFPLFLPCLSPLPASSPFLALPLDLSLHLPAFSYLCPPMKILFVCLGNICRSPLAEGILRQKALAAGLDWEVDSAGTNGYHTGEAPHALSQKVARLNGIDISLQRARQFTPADFQRFDKIYAMAGDVVDDIRRIARKKIRCRQRSIC